MNASKRTKRSSASPAKSSTSPAEFEARIRSTADWRATTLAQLREVIRQADPEVIEELKWKKPSNPAGDPVWSHNGMICVGNTLKASVRLTFVDGARIPDPKKLFNTRLDSKSVRGVDVFEGEAIDRAALTAIVRTAVRLNAE